MTQKIKYFKIIVNCGHLGGGKSVEVTRFIYADCMGDAFAMASKFPRVKCKTSGGISVKGCWEISYEEYFEGKKLEAENPYLQITKSNKKNLHKVA